MSQEENPAATHTSPFEAIRRVNDDGTEYWSARDLSKILGYALWQKFKNVVEKAQEACQNSGQGVSDHFIQVDKMIKVRNSPCLRNQHKQKTSALSMLT